MEFFERQWFTYRTIVNHNLMEHGQLAAATAAALEGWLVQRPAGTLPPQMADLGCGDLALLAPLLQRLSLGSYTGLDLCAAVLPRAEAALGPVPYPSHRHPPQRLRHPPPQRRAESHLSAGGPPPDQPAGDLLLGRYIPRTGRDARSLPRALQPTHAGMAGSQPRAAGPGDRSREPFRPAR